MDTFSNVELFEGKNLSDLFKEIYDNSSNKRIQINDLIKSLSPLIEGIGDATLLVPLIKEYLEISVKNDEQLVKLAQIVQRMDSGKKAVTGSDFFGDLQGLLVSDAELQKEIEETKEKETA